MSGVAVRAENLGKLYRLGHRERYSTLRDAIARALAAPFGRAGNGGKPASEFIWALKQVSFEIKFGEVVGIIGGNGAGKSTLLKILSRITEPTEGEAAIYGRVGSLLEVGTGFHPELTGRENIFLNGAILGMKRTEIERKFDEIVGFAEVERFIDTPVKHYSSGMYMRLAFAVAAHLEPEILIVDEVLAVGDAAFQKKCLGKMGEVAKEGRTVLFVSHNLGAVNALCQKALHLEQGSVLRMGEASQIVEAYLARQIGQNAGHKEWFGVDRDVLNTQIEGFQITEILLCNESNAILGACTGDPLRLTIRYKTDRQFNAPAFWVSFRDIYGQEIIRLSTMPISGYEITALYPEGSIDLLIESLPLVGGRYNLDIAFLRERLEFIVKLENVVQFDVQPRDVYRSGLLMDRSRGIIVAKHRWNHMVCEAR